MIYILALVLSIFGALNLYASWKVLHDELSTGKQKLLQLCLIWLLPIMGAVLTISLVSGTRHLAVDVPSRNGTEFVNYWHSSEGSNYGSDVNLE